MLFDVYFETASSVVCKFSFNQKIVIETKNKSVLLVAARPHTVFDVELHLWRTGTPWGHLQRDILSSSRQSAAEDAQKVLMLAPNHVRQHHDPRSETGFWPHSCHQPPGISDSIK